MTDTVRFMLSGGIIIPPEKRKTKEEKLSFTKRLLDKMVGLISQLSPSSYIGANDVDMAVISDVVVHFDLHVSIKELEHFEKIKSNFLEIFNQPVNKNFFYYLTIYDWHQVKSDIIKPR